MQRASKQKVKVFILSNTYARRRHLKISLTYTIMQKIIVYEVARNYLSQFR